MKKILLIDSDENLVKKIGTYFESQGYDTIQAAQGSVGIQKALEHSPDIILCDTNVPILSGYEVFNTLQQINSTSIIPFVFLTDNSSYEDLRAAMNLGVDDYIVKPYKLDDLHKLVSTRLEKQEKLMTIADEKFNILIEHSNDGMFMLNDERLSFVNQKFCKILGYTKKELIGVGLVNIVFKDDIQFVIEKIDRCMQGIHKELKLEFRAIKRDNMIVNVGMNGSLINSAGKKTIVGSLIELDIYSKTEKCESLNKTNVNFTKRELEVLHFICEGNSNSEIAKILRISDRTVEGHRSNVLNKTGCKNSVCLAIFAVKNGFYKIN